MEEYTNTHFLFPASLFANEAPHAVTTVLGSCVAICLYDSKLKIGGINHFMLPLWNGQGLATPKFGNIAIEKLLDKMFSLGSSPENLIAKVFGGGEVLESKSNSFNIGARNIEIALQSLKEKNIKIVAQSLGGELGRKIIFFTDTGSVKHKFIQKTQYNP